MTVGESRHADGGAAMRVWMLCEAFTLTGDAFGHETVHESLTPWSLPCASRKSAMRELRQRVRERVIENYEGADGTEEDIESDIRDVLAGKTRLWRGKYECKYSTDDRAAVWQVYSCEVMR